jgi:hypothetical protein
MTLKTKRAKQIKLVLSLSMSKHHGTHRELARTPSSTKGKIQDSTVQTSCEQLA